MSDTMINVLSVLLVAGGVAADVVLLYMGVRMLSHDRNNRLTRRAELQARWNAAAGRKPVRPPALIMAAAAGLALCAVGVPLWADEPPAVANPPAAPALLTISTDRPGFSDTTGIMQTMHLNIESGYTFTHRDRDGVTVDKHNGPEVVARLGLLEDRLEVRVAWSGYVHAETDAGPGGVSTVNGFSDPALGFKLKLTDQGQIADWMPRLVLEVMTTFGGGSDEISSQRAEPIVKLLLSYDLGKSLGEQFTGWTLTANANVTWTNSSGQRFTQGQGSLSLSFPTIENCSGFVEYFVLGPNSKGTDAAHYVDLGGAWLVTPRAQLDARVGLGLNSEADNVFFGVGFSIAF